MNSKISILLIGPFPGPLSGVSIANQVVREVLSDDSQFEVDLINTSYSRFDEEIGKFSFKKTFFYLALYLNIFKIFKHKIIYITPGQTFYGILKYGFFIILGSIFRKELILHVHGNHLGEEYKSLNGIKKNIFYCLVSRFSKGIVLSDSLKHNLTPFIDQGSVFCLPNFAQDYLYEEDKNLVNDELRIFYLSNLMKEKGIICLLKALKNLEKYNITYKAKIAGNIDEKFSKEILQLLNELENTKYVGVVNGEAKKKSFKMGKYICPPNVL